MIFAAALLYAYSTNVPCYWVGASYPNGYWQCNAYVPDLYIEQPNDIYRYIHRHRDMERDGDTDRRKH